MDLDGRRCAALRLTGSFVLEWRTDSTGAPDPLIALTRPWMAAESENHAAPSLS
jgi:hypothetical protein